MTALLDGLKVKVVVREERNAGARIDAVFHGSLRPAQEDAVAKVLEHDDGLICAPTAFGKTAVASWLIAKRGVNALVIEHRQQLLDQWRERLAMFLNIPIDQIGQVGGGKTKRTGVIDERSSRGSIVKKRSRISLPSTAILSSTNATIFPPSRSNR